MEVSESLSGLINQLIQQGYVLDLNRHSACKDCDIHHFQVDIVYRFEGLTDSGESWILYALSSSSSDVKDILINIYGVYANTETSSIEHQLDLPAQAPVYLL